MSFCNTPPSVFEEKIYVTGGTGAYCEYWILGNHFGSIAVWSKYDTADALGAMFYKAQYNCCRAKQRVLIWGQGVVWWCVPVGFEPSIDGYFYCRFFVVLGSVL